MKYIYRNGIKSSAIVGKDIDFIANQLQNGKVVAFPTDTVYGLACVFDNEYAIQKIKVIKGRLESKPLPMMVVDYTTDLNGIAKVNVIAKQLFEAFSPGNITLILEKEQQLAEFVTNGQPTIAIRIPNDEFVLSLIKKVGKPLLVTSANKSDYPTCQNVEQLLNQLFNQIDYIVEGTSGSNIASTIVDTTDNQAKVVREGEISKTEIAKIAQVK